MRKYLAVFKATWQNSVEYRVEFITHILFGLISLFVMLFIWQAIFKQVNTFGSYTFSSMFTYLVLAKFLHFVTRSNIARRLSEDIKQGNLSLFLIKPLSVVKYWLAIFLADRFFEILIRAFLLILSLLLIPHLFNLDFSVNLLLFLLLIFIALIFNFLFNILQAALTFWLIDIRLFSTFLWLACSFLAGNLVPADLFPEPLKTINSFLPFSYTLFFPIRVLQGTVSLTDFIVGLSILLFWIIFFLIIFLFLWQKGIKHYEATGQ